METTFLFEDVDECRIELKKIYGSAMVWLETAHEQYAFTPTTARAIAEALLKLAGPE